WPLDFVISFKILDQYCDILQFVFMLMCARSILSQLWLNMMHEWKTSVVKLSSQQKHVACIRSWMNNSLNDLYSHIIYAFILPKKTELELKFSSAKTIQEMRLSHETAVSSMCSSYFSHARLSTIREILKTCLDFRHLLK